jgi:Protein of unknown function (DUF1353)
MPTRYRASRATILRNSLIKVPYGLAGSGWWQFWLLGVAMNLRRFSWNSLAAIVTITTLAGCASWINYGEGKLAGHVVVQWVAEDKFIYLKQTNPVRFKPSFMSVEIIPDTMYTDGGSVPRIFWNIPGLSPWALGPAYIVHDWLFEVHRCRRTVPPEVADITFEQSAQILAEVAKSLVDAGLIQNNRLEEIVWAIQTRYARDLWDRPATPEECTPPPSTFVKGRTRLAGARTVVDFVIPPPRQRSR